MRRFFEHGEVSPVQPPWWPSCSMCGTGREVFEGLNGKRLLEKRDYCLIDGELFCQNISDHQTCEHWTPEPEHDGHFKSGR